MTPARSQLIDMLKSVDLTNSQVEPRWLFKGYLLGRTLRVDLAYLSVYLGDVPMRPDAREVDYTRAREKLMDVWHWLCSMALLEHMGHYENAAEALESSMKFSRTEVINVIGRSFTMAGLTLNEAVDTLSLFASLNYSFPALFEQIMIGCGSSWEDVHGHFTS